MGWLHRAGDENISQTVLVSLHATDLTGEPFGEIGGTRKRLVLKVRQSITHGDGENESQLDGKRQKAEQTTWLTKDTEDKTQTQGLAENEQTSSHMGNRDHVEGTVQIGIVSWFKLKEERWELPTDKLHFHFHKRCGVFCRLIQREIKSDRVEGFETVTEIMKIYAALRGLEKKAALQLLCK